VAEQGVQLQEETVREWSAEADSSTVSFPVALFPGDLLHLMMIRLQGFLAEAGAAFPVLELLRALPVERPSLPLSLWPPVLPPSFSPSPLVS
jgi:hypothetical protein